jgi:CBS domain-containing protein
MTTTYLSFDLAENAEKFVGAALDQGARPEDISVIAYPGVLDNHAEDRPDGEDIAEDAKKGLSTTTPEDAATGAVAGAGVGVGVGVLAGLASIFVPGFGLVAGGGALATAIAGAAATAGAGAVAGGVTGYLKDLGVEGDVPENFEEDYKGGKVIVGVAYHENGLTPDELAQLARKYHAVRSSDEIPPVSSATDDSDVSPEPTEATFIATEKVTDSDPIRASEGPLQAKDIMTATPACCTPDTPLPEVARQMVEHDCGAIPIVEDAMGKQVVGILTDRDIVTRTVAERRDPMDLKARDVMTPNVATVNENSSLSEVAEIMEQRQVRRIPVVDAQNCCVGIVSQADLARKGPEDMTAEMVREVSQPRTVWM